jgi:hypothetical protein
MIPSKEQMADHKEEVNCAPLSLVIIAGTPNRAIHPSRVANSKILLRTTYFTAGNQLGTKIEHAKPLQNQ